MGVAAGDAGDEKHAAFWRVRERFRAKVAVMGQRGSMRVQGRIMLLVVQVCFLAVVKRKLQYIVSSWRVCCFVVFVFFTDADAIKVMFIHELRGYCTVDAHGYD